jgi:hypothetical protein
MLFSTPGTEIAIQEFSLNTQGHLFLKVGDSTHGVTLKDYLDRVYYRPD